MHKFIICSHTSFNKKGEKKSIQLLFAAIDKQKKMFARNYNPLPVTKEKQIFGYNQWTEKFRIKEGNYLLLSGDNLIFKEKNYKHQTTKVVGVLIFCNKWGFPLKIKIPVK